ncbi:xanthine dehydrogenase accessory protein XdhC [Coralliovum pocilloporae]|uniref:xanthine dehydrogenase accessory protein XdhC n=1 Tax=Coralliovum pocilloporae TaxID=3066369 RepID=UPI003307A0A0
MASFASTPAAFLETQKTVVEITLSEVRGSSPRGAGTFMLVSEKAFWGTVGGGRFEQIAIDHARAMLKSGEEQDRLDVPLGPEIGQCCGGHVTASFKIINPSDRARIKRRMRSEEAARPHVIILGAGHVGRALADLLQHLPVKVQLVDSRPEELGRCTARVETCLSALPECEIADAPPKSAFVVLTHDHGLDFLLTSAALDRGDAAYVGLIGSATKRTRFERYRLDQDGDGDCSGLTCPIGAGGLDDKRPEVIAAFVIPEILSALAKAGVMEKGGTHGKTSLPENVSD